MISVVFPDNVEENLERWIDLRMSLTSGSPTMTQNVADRVHEWFYVLPR